MAKTPAKHGKYWTPQNITHLNQLAKGNTLTGLIAYKIGRTEDAVRANASDQNISLKLPIQSPYNRRKP